VCFYTAKVRITVTAGGATIVRDGIGLGPTSDCPRSGARNRDEGSGDRRHQAGPCDVRQPVRASALRQGQAAGDQTPAQGPEKSLQRSASEAAPAIPRAFALVHHDGARRRFETAQPFIDAVLALVPTLPTLEALYAFWEANLESLGLLRAQATTDHRDPLHAIIDALKGRARLLGRTTGGAEPEANGATEPHASALAAPKDRRLRSKEHLAFVGKQPCLVCGRRPAHAHHPASPSRARWVSRFRRVHGAALCGPPRCRPQDVTTGVVGAVRHHRAAEICRAPVGGIPTRHRRR
jgi:hypothetical protein